MRLISSLSRRRRAAALAGAGAVVAAGLIAGPVPVANAATSCDVEYSTDDWPGGFTASITINNLGDPLDGWELEFDFPGSQQVVHGWSAEWDQDDNHVTATSMSWNANLATGASTTIGFNGSWTGSNPPPTSFTINDTTCGEEPPGDLSILASPSSVTVPEGGSSSVNIRLSEAPSGSVLVTLSASGDSDISVSPTSVTLGSNWSAGVDVTVNAAEDGDEIDGTATITASASGYEGATVSATENDNDGGPPGGGEHVENPFAGAQGYVNPDWAARVEQEAASTGGTLGQQMQQVANYSTAVWMDRIAAIEGSGDAMGLREHLDTALAQQSGDTPMAIMVVIYDLPNRDCAALASNGELRISENGLQRYQTEYIDPIIEILSDPAYADLRIVTVVEPDSLPNLVTNVSGEFATEDCIEAQRTGAYVEGIQYAIDRLHPISNVYLYLDIAHSGWLGWPDNLSGSVNLYTSTIQGTDAGLESLDGFITNTANYTPTEEPYLPNPNLQVGGQQIMSADFYEWNPRFDEIDFAQDLRSQFVSRGFPSGIGMLIDTSRNGWGGSDRPSGTSSSNNHNTYVNESRVDRRPHRGGWCNQAGAGIGERPTTSTPSGIDAFVWVKPPGESDGVSEPGIVDPDDPNKKFDAMCDPDAENRYNGAYPTNALPNAPHAGRWFPEQFRMLVENAYPPIQ